MGGRIGSNGLFYRQNQPGFQQLGNEGLEVLGGGGGGYLVFGQDFVEDAVQIC